MAVAPITVCQASGGECPGKAVLVYGRRDDVRDVHEGLASVPDADADSGCGHGLDVVVGITDGHGSRHGDADVLADGLDTHRLG